MSHTDCGIQVCQNRW